MQLWSKFEDYPLWLLRTQLKATGEYFLYVQSFMKYSSWPNMHWLLSVYIPKMYLYSKLEDSVLCGNLETELKCKKREYFFYVQPSVSWPNMHSCFSCCSPDISMEKIWRLYPLVLRNWATQQVHILLMCMLTSMCSGRTWRVLHKHYFALQSRAKNRPVLSDRSRFFFGKTIS